MTALNSRLQLALINRKKKQNILQQGFTLVELMVVIIIVGVLSAVALPNLLGQRDRASAQSFIGGMNAFAGQCNANILSENPSGMPGLLPLADNPILLGGLGQVHPNPAISLDVVCGTLDTTTGIYTALDPVTFTNRTNFPNPDRLQGLRCGVNVDGIAQFADGIGDNQCLFTVTDGVVIGEWFTRP